MPTFTGVFVAGSSWCLGAVVDVEKVAASALVVAWWRSGDADAAHIHQVASRCIESLRKWRTC